MMWIRISTTLLLLLLPLAATSFYRRRPDSDLPLIRRRRLALLLATGGAIAVYGALLICRFEGWFSLWREMPYAFRWSDSPDEIAWVLSFPLWFPFAIRLLVALRPEAAGPYPSGVTRTALLVPREGARLGTGYGLAAGAIVAGSGAVVLARVLSGAGPAAIPSGSWAAVAALLAGALIPLVTFPLAIRVAAREPEPLDDRASDEFVSAYDGLRRTKIRGFAALGLAMAGLFSLLAAAAAWVPSGAAVGAAGGIGGTAVGILGAAFGVKASNGRMRIRRLLDERNSE